jgi:hypothetical protein
MKTTRSDHLAAVQTQRRHSALRVDRQIASLAVLTAVANQVDGNGVDLKALQRQGDAHPIAGGGTVVGVEIHVQALLLVIFRKRFTQCVSCDISL